jgi:ABC-type multidrug transport system fused ATPase/permease subunit
VLICVLVYVCFGVLGLVVQSSQVCILLILAESEIFSVEIFMFACSGEALTKRLRSKTFRAILRQDIAYFDQAKHNTGALCTYLATGASTVQGASGVRLGIIFQNIVTIGLGILIGFIFSWQLTLLMIAFLPMIIFGAVLQIRLMDNFAEKDKEFLEDAGKVFFEKI